MKISVTPCFQGMEGKKTFSVHDRAYTCKTSNCKYYRDEDFLSKTGKIQWIVSEDIV